MTDWTKALARVRRDNVFLVGGPLSGCRMERTQQIRRQAVTVVEFPDGPDKAHHYRIHDRARVGFYLGAKRGRR